MQKKLATFISPLLEIRPGEGRAVSLLFFLALCTGLAQVLGRVAANTLFLENFSARGMPWVYLGLAVASPLATYLYFLLGTGKGRDRRLESGQLNITFAAILVVHLLVWGLASLFSRSAAILVAVFTWVFVLDTLSSLAFWELARRLLDPSREKRLAGLALQGELLARWVGLLVAPLWVLGFGVTSLLLLSAAAWLAALIILNSVRKQRELHRRGEGLSPARAAAPLSTASPISSLKEAGSHFSSRLPAGRYNLGIAGVAAAAVAVFFLTDQVYQVQLDSLQVSTVLLASLIAGMEALAGLAAWIARPLLASPLLQRRGLMAGMLALPLGTALAAILVAAAFTFSQPASLVIAGVFVLRLVVVSLLNSTHQAAGQILLQAVPEERRETVRFTIETFLEPGAAGLVGMILLFTLFPAPLPSLAVIPLYWLAPLVALFTLLAYVVSRKQPEVFAQTLERRNLSELAFQVNEASSLAIIGRGLESPQPGPVIYLLNLLEEAQHPSLAEFLRRLLTHPSPEVRQDALHRIERLAFTDNLDAVRQCLATEQVPAVKGQCVRTLAALGENEILEEVLPYLDSDDPVIRQNAMIGLLYSGGLEGVLEAGHFLLEMSYAVDPEQRIAAANVLGEVSISNFYRPLLRLLRDKDPQVRRAALKAAGRLKNPRLWPLIVHNLGEAGYAGSARTALVAAGEPAIAFIENTFDNPETSNRTRIQLAQVAGRIGGSRAVSFLQKHLEHPDHEVRTATLQALRQCHYLASGSEARKVEEAFYAEVRGASWTAAALADLPSIPAVMLLRAALMEKYLRHRNQAALLVQLLYDPDTLRSAWRTLNWQTSHMPQRDLDEQRNALNILNVLLPQDKKDMLLALLENPQADKTASRLGAFYPQTAVRPDQRLSGLLSSTDPQITPWLRACTFWTLSRLDPAAQAAWLKEYQQWSASDSPMAAIAARTLYFLLPRSSGGVSMLSIMEKVLSLRTVNIISETPDEVLAEMAVLLEEVEYKNGEIILRKGEQGRYFYIIVAGQVRVHDDRRTFAVLEPGNVFGEMSILDGLPISQNCTAASDVRLLRMDQDSFYEVMADRVEVARGIIRMLALRLRTTMEANAKGQPKEEQPVFRIEAL